MKFGAHIYLWTDRWSDDQLDLLDNARGLGLEWVELSTGDDVEFAAGPTRRRAESLGLELTLSPGGLWPEECDISSPDPARRREGLRWHREAIDLAGELGATAYTGAIYGHPGVIDRQNPPDAQYPTIAEHLHDLAEHAAERGVKLALEPMSRFRTHAVNTPQQLMRLLSMAEHDNLFALLDTYHMVPELRDYAAAVRTYGDRLWGVHACENDRGVPGGGLVPWRELFGALADTDFGGHVGLETYNTSLRQGRFALGRGIFRDLCPDGDEFVRQGLDFLRGMAGDNNTY
ncbi:MAG: sugar phosphate isomerase/epimerase family protein [Candidatus Brocadiia bacterium]